MQLEQYLEWFARAQLLVITAEALRRDRLDTLRQACEFLVSMSVGGHRN